MAKWISIEEAKNMSGLRLVLTAGVPGPWGESAKAVFQAKGIDYVCVAQSGGLPNDELREWTGEINAPQAILDAQPARTGWAEILFLAERIQPEPSLIPTNASARVQMFGLCHELCGENGFGWMRRLTLLAPIMGLPEDHPARQTFGGMALRYGYREDAASAAPERAAEIVKLMGDQLRDQKKAGHKYMMGAELSALDLYWAAFAALIEPLPEEVCDMAAPMRVSYGAKHPAIEAVLDRALIDHRDFIYAEHLVLPLDLGS